MPIDLGGNQTGIHKVAYEALLEHLGIDDDVDDHGRRAAARPAVRGGARAVPRRYALHRRRARRPGFKGGDRRSARATAGCGTT